MLSRTSSVSGSHGDQVRIALLHARLVALDDGHRALKLAAAWPRLVLQDQRAVGRDRQVLVARVDGGRRAGGQRGLLQDQARVTVEQGDLVLPRGHDPAVGQDVEVGIGNPRTRHIAVVEVGAPDLAARGRVGLGDEGPRRNRALGRWRLTPRDEKLAGAAVVDVRRCVVFHGAAPREDLVRSVEAASERGAGEHPAALRIGNLRAVDRRVIARRRQVLRAGQFLQVQAHVARKRTVGRDFVRGEPDLADAVLHLLLRDRPEQPIRCNRQQDKDDEPHQFEDARSSHLNPSRGR